MQSLDDAMKHLEPDASAAVLDIMPPETTSAADLFGWLCAIVDGSDLVSADHKQLVHDLAALLDVSPGLAALPADQDLSTVVEATDWQDAPAVVGTADASLFIERISSDAEELFNRPVSEMLGASLFALVAEEDVPACLAALGDVSAGQSGITLYLNIKTGVVGSAIRCEVLLLPLRPPPSCAFVLLPMPAGMPGGHISGDL